MQLLQPDAAHLQGGLKSILTPPITATNAFAHSRIHLGGIGNFG